MAASNSSNALVKRGAEDLALMPPPPLKRIKRPPKVLDEDEYTSALSEIIARDYFPGLRESERQRDYLLALESNNEAWIAEAGHKLREAMTPLSAGQTRRSARNIRFDTPSATPSRGATPAADTPRGFHESATPVSVAGTEASRTTSEAPEINTSSLSLSAFQAKYTSEDNESFNALVDKQNEKRRLKHAHLWTQDQRIPSARQITWEARETQLRKQKEDDENAGKALIPMTSGAVDSRPAKPDSWKIQKPDNTFMFNATSVDEDGIQTTHEIRQATSKAPPKQVIYANTRFQPFQYVDDPGPIPPSPSLNTDIIVHREVGGSEAGTEFAGGETPRVNGYAFVDEDEPDNSPTNPAASGPSYRDLLAGQVGDSTPNPFKLSGMRKREDLHHRMVEITAKKKRLKDKETTRELMADTPIGGKTPAAGGNMTPAARKLMEKLGRTPVASRRGKVERMNSEDMWTPTPRRKVGA